MPVFREIYDHEKDDLFESYRGVAQIREEMTIIYHKIMAMSPSRERDNAATRLEESALWLEQTP